MKLIFKPIHLIFYDIYNIVYIYFIENSSNRQILPRDYKEFTKKL